MISSIVGLVLILIGIFLPTAMLVDPLRSTPVSSEMREQLLLGAMIFKACLVILGLLVVILGRRMSFWKTEVETEAPVADPHRKSTLIILGGILFAATVLRLYGLNDGLWFDEIVTYFRYVRLPFAEIITAYESQNQHILYSVLAHGAFVMFGESAWALRLPAVLFGVGSIWALYLLGKEVSSPREGLLSAALMAFSYHHVWFSQNARGYTGLLFFTILSSWLFLKALREPKPRLWLLYAIAVALGAYTLIYMAFVVMGHFIIYLVTLFARRKQIWSHRWLGLFLGFCLAGFFTLLLHALLLPQFLAAFAKAEVVGTIWTHPLWGLLEFIKGMEVNFSGTVIAIAALVVFGAGLLSYARTNPAVIGLLFIPVVICVVVKVAMGHHMWPRSLIFAVGFGALVVVRGAVLMGQWAGRILKLPADKSALVGTGCCVALVLVSAVSVPFAYGPKQDFLGARDFVEQNREPGDSVVTVGLAAFPYKNLYKLDWEEVQSVTTLNAISSRAKRTWLVYTIPIHLQDVYPELTASIRRDFKIVKPFHGTLNEGTIFVCQFDPQSPTLSIRMSPNVEQY